MTRQQINGWVDTGISAAAVVLGGLYIFDVIKDIFAFVAVVAGALYSTLRLIDYFRGRKGE
mgnify:CR=1 FL=1